MSCIPQQDGVSERANRMISGRVMIMILGLFILGFSYCRSRSYTSLVQTLTREIFSRSFGLGILDFGVLRCIGHVYPHFLGRL